MVIRWINPTGSNLTNPVDLAGWDMRWGVDLVSRMGSVALSSGRVHRLGGG